MKKTFLIIILTSILMSLTPPSNFFEQQLKFPRVQTANRQKGKAVGKLLSSKNGIILKNEITFLFCISLLFLLFSLYKENNFKSVYQMRAIRINNQLNFNFCIFYNVMICFIFLFFNFDRAITKKVKT